MTEIHKTVDVNAPLETVYSYWSDFSNFPRFMDNVESVERTGTETSHWRVKIAGKEMEWDAKQELEPNRSVSWRAMGDVRNDGTVKFTPIAGGQTRVDVTIHHEPKSGVEKIGAGLGLDDRAVQKDLERFKEILEGDRQPS